ncbi:hypothetical protein ACOTWN_10945, partial [Aliarcobacter butzleri]
MCSSAELVRESANIVDTSNKKERDTALILRDGKPNPSLLDFEEYAKIMSGSLRLKGRDIVEIPSSEPESNET